MGLQVKREGVWGLGGFGVLEITLQEQGGWLRHQKSSAGHGRPGQPAGKAKSPPWQRRGWPRHRVNGPVPLEARPGWFVQLPMIGGLNQPPRLRPLKEASRHFLNGRSHPSLSKEGTSAFPSVVFNALGEGGPKGRMRANTSPYLSAMSSLRFAERVNHGANGHH